jgi:hypothetical protein
MSEKEPKKITVTLAHLLPEDEAVRLGVTDPRTYKPGQDIEVPRASAEMLFNAAYLNGNPKNPEHARRILGGAGEDEAAPAVVAGSAAPAPPSVPASASPAAGSTPAGAAAAAALPSARLPAPGSQS